MRRSRRSNVLLMEILIAVLFFMLASTIILKIYVTAREQSGAAGSAVEAQAFAQNLSERLYISDDAVSTLTQNGFAEDDGAYVYAAEGFVITAIIENEAAAAGELRTVTLSAEIGQHTIFVLPCTRYMPGEVSP